MRALARVAIAVMLVALPCRARAAVDWLTLRSTCPVDREQLAQRIEREVAGTRSPELRLLVELGAGAPVRGQIMLRQGSRDLGEKRVEAGSCAAALDLLVAIAALALSSFPAPDAEPAASASYAAAVPAAPAERTRRPQPPAQAHDEGDRRAHAGKAQSWRVLAGAGIALGAGSPTTLLVTGGGAVSLGPGELRLLGRYGVPSTSEEVEASARSVRRDFGAAAMDYCYGLDRGHWLSLCGGLEMVARRERRLAASAQDGRAESTHRAPLFGPSASLLLVLRGVAGQPQLELAALVPVWGAPPAPGFRAALGGGLPF